MVKFLRCFLIMCCLIFSLLACQPINSENIDHPKDAILITTTPAYTLRPTLVPTPLPTIASLLMTPTWSPSLTPTTGATLTIVPILYPNLDGLLAFLGNDNYIRGIIPVRYDLFLLDRNGQTIRLTKDAIVESVSWSPDGRNLLFSAILPGHYSFDLYLVDIANTNLMPVSLLKDLEMDSNESEATWSPDGDKIVFTQYVAGKHKIYVMNRDGTQVRFLTEGGSPSWSPNGEQIVFIRRLSENPSGDIYTINQNGEGLGQITTDILANKPVFSPNSNLIAFANHNGEGEAGIYVVQIDGNGLTKLASYIVNPSWFSETEVLFGVANNIFMVNFQDHQRTILAQLPINFYVKFASPQPLNP